jgi:hypothetical protein
MINAGMKPTEVFATTENYNDLGVKFDAPVKIKTIDCFIMIRSDQDKMLDVYTYQMADFIGLTADKTIVKGNILKVNNSEFKVIESLNFLRYNKLLLKKVK